MGEIGIAETIGLVLAALSFMTGSAWWMSALYSRVNAIRKSIGDLVVQIHESNLEHRSEMNKLWTALVEIDKRLHEHDVRIVKLEAK